MDKESLELLKLIKEMVETNRDLIDIHKKRIGNNFASLIALNDMLKKLNAKLDEIERRKP